MFLHGSDFTVHMRPKLARSEKALPGMYYILNVVSKCTLVLAQFLFISVNGQSFYDALTFIRLRIFILADMIINNPCTVMAASFLRLLSSSLNGDRSSRILRQASPPPPSVDCVCIWIVGWLIYWWSIGLYVLLVWSVDVWWCYCLICGVVILLKVWIVK